MQEYIINMFLMSYKEYFETKNATKAVKISYFGGKNIL